MRLYGRVIISALLPLILAMGVIVFQMNRLVVNEIRGLEQADELKINLINRRVEELQTDLHTAGGILAGSKDAARAVQFSDSDFLYSWSSLFLEGPVSLVVFTDLDGIVLSRSTNEMRFGDDISGLDPVRSALEGGEFLGYFFFDGVLYVGYAKQVELYNEIPVGTVLAGSVVDPEFTGALTAGTEASLSLQPAGETEITRGIPENIRKTETLESAMELQGIPMESAVLYFPEDASLYRLERTRAGFILTILGVLVVLPAVFFVLLRIYLRPYALLVSGLFRLSKKSINFSELRKEFGEQFIDGRHEVTIIAEAVSELTVTLEENLNLLEKLSVTDKLTQLYNRNYLDDAFEREIRRVKRYSKTFSIILADIDHFKNVNDVYGHAAGDTILCRTAETLLHERRDTDVVGRWGGEEFLILCPETDEDGCFTLAEKMRRAAQSMETGIGEKITVSFGVAEYRNGDTAETFFARADKALYEAKRRGRNRTVRSVS